MSATSTSLGTAAARIAIGTTLAFFACGVVGGGGSQARSSAAIRNGKIAFSEAHRNASPFSTPSDLYVIDPDGSNRQRMSACDEPDCTLRSFAWSPGGRRLAFLRGSMGGMLLRADLALYVVDADGRNERRVDGCGKPRWPSCGDFAGSQLSWSPNGSEMVLPREGSLYVFDVARGSFRRLTKCMPKRCFDWHPAWAARGGRIAFVRTLAPYSYALYTVRSDGSGLKRLTRPMNVVGNPAWSPDGRRIAFEYAQILDGIKVIAADGSSAKRLPTGPSGAGTGVPVWSPDGKQIAYLTTPGYTGNFRAAVWVIKPNGTGRRRLYRSGCCIDSWGRPIWSPDGKSIAFGVDIRSNPDHSGVFVIKPNGVGLRRIVAAPTEARWQRAPPP